jgi:hypothetical protein
VRTEGTCEIEYSFEIKLLGWWFRASGFRVAQRKLLPARSYLQLSQLEAASAVDQRSNGIASGDQEILGLDRDLGNIRRERVSLTSITN